VTRRERGPQQVSGDTADAAANGDSRDVCRAWPGPLVLANGGRTRKPCLAAWHLRSSSIRAYFRFRVDGDQSALRLPACYRLSPAQLALISAALVVMRTDLAEVDW
jgi:hypothetical protein